MKIDSRTLKPITEKTTFSTFMMAQGIRWRNLHVKYSFDSSRVLVFGTTLSNKKEPEKYFIGVYDHNFSKLWERTQEIPFLGKDIEIVDYFVTNKGDVFVVIKQFEQGTNNESVKVNGEKVPAYKTKLFYYPQNQANANEFTIDMEGNFLRDIRISGDGENYLNLFGLYMNQPYGSIAGYFRLNFDFNTSTLKTQKIAAFDNQLLDLIHTVDRQGKPKSKDPGIVWSYRMAKSIVRSDSSKDYIIELFQIQQTSRINGGYAPVFYLYGDVIDINVKKMERKSLQEYPNCSLQLCLQLIVAFFQLHTKTSCY